MFESKRGALSARMLPVAAMLLFSGAAHAQDNGIYVGGSAGGVSTDYDWGLGGAEGAPDEESAFKLIGGVRPLDPFAVEVNYTDLGNTTVSVPAISGPGRAGLETKALSVSAVGYFSLPLIDIFGRVGVARWESDPRDLFASLGSENGTDPTYGVGAQVRLGSIAIRAEYEDYDISGGSAELASIGVTYTFF